MRKYIITFLVFIVGMSMFFLLYQYNVKTIKRDGIMETLEKTSETAYLNALDGSYRVTQKDMNIVSQAVYESIFKDLFLNHATVNFEGLEVTFRFDYLVDIGPGESVNTTDPDPLIQQGGLVKGIQSTVWVDGQRYSVRYILDISKGRNRV